MKKVSFIIILFVSSYCKAQDALPEGYQIIAEKTGDLDRDGIKEKVIVYNTPDTTEDGIVRELCIFKINNSQWKLWKKTKNAILKSQEGGMMGDPFEGIEIVDGVLIISVSGGSSWKWSHQDKYRYQNNEFRLIGYTSHSGKICEYWEDVDFNLVTGKLIVKKEFEDCDKNQEIYKTENEVFYKKGIIISLERRTTMEVKLVSPKYKHEFYL
ncbi:hypothetical protein BH11BAC3_BH11BAC3_02210 [soil metagenome]